MNVAIRIAVLRVLRRYRFFTEDFLRATGDWESHVQQEEWKQRLEKVISGNKSVFQHMSRELNGINKTGRFLREAVPPLPPEIEDRANYPLGLFLKSIVHSLAAACLRDRGEEAGEHYQSESSSFERKLEGKENAREFIEQMPTERCEEFMEKAMEFMKEREDRAEPGDDWVDFGEVVASDEAFEENRRRILQGYGNELQMYLTVLTKRQECREQYSGIDLLKEQDALPDEKPDWESGEERDELIAQLEAITGQSFREERKD